LVVAVVTPVAYGFSPPPALSGLSRTSSTLLQSKKNPQGAPITVQEDEDAAMWIEDENGKARKALQSPVGGRPINKLTKEQVQARNQGGKKKTWWNPF
jgi:hypothetical protein